MAELKPNPVGSKVRITVRIDDIKEFRQDAFVRKRIYDTRNMYFNLYCIDKGQINPLHKHPKSDEILYFVEGRGECEVGNRAIPITPRMTVWVPPNTPHEIRNTGTAPLLAVLAQAPLPCEHVLVKR